MSNFTTLEPAFKSHMCRDRPLRLQRSCLIVEAKKAETVRDRQEKSRGTPDRPRLSVFRSNNHIYAQVIDDTQSHTLCSASTLMKQVIETTGGRGSDERAAYIVGQLVGKRALQKGISQVYFDGGDFSYKGRVKAVGEGARAAGLEF